MKGLYDKKAYKKKRQEEVNYWQSYSDLMAAMLLVFVLIIAFTIYHAKDDYENIDARLADRDKEIANLKDELEKSETILAELREKEEENQGLAAEFQELKKEAEGLKVQLNEVIAIRRDIVEELEKEFADSSVGASIDPATGTFRFEADVLFDYDDSTLTDVGRKTLDRFFPKYFSVILKNRKYISEVIIEGHADNQGGYSYNMELSQERAFAVVNYCIGDEAKEGKGVNYDMFSKNKLRYIREIVTANGRSYYDLVYDHSGSVDEEASRRVEIKFRVKGENISVLEN